MKYNVFQVYSAYLKVNYLSALQYKGWIFNMFHVMLYVITDPITVFLSFYRFGNIGMFSVEKIMLVYAMAVTSFGLAETFSRGFDVFPFRIKSGEFDRILLRPRSTFVQILGMVFHLHRLSRVIGGMIIMFITLIRLQISITLKVLMQILASLIGGYLTYTGIFVIFSSIVFFTIESFDWIYIFTNGSYQVTKIPEYLLPKMLKYTFTFVMPLLLFSYYPAAAICGWGVPWYFGYLGLPAGLVFFLISVIIWNVGVKKYSSTGS